MSHAVDELGALVRVAGYPKALLALANAVANRLEQRLGREVLISRPYLFHVELVNRCNTNCQLCPVGLGYSSRLRDQAQAMSTETFEKVLALAGRHVIRINFGIWGEPSLNQQLAGFVAMSSARKILTQVMTNGLRFSRDRELFHHVCDAGLHSLLISLHGMSEATYQAYQPGKSFAEIMDFLDHCSSYTRSKGIEVRLSLAITSKNEHEVDAFQEYCRTKGFIPSAYPASMNVRFRESKDQQLAVIGAWRNTLFRHQENPMLARYYDDLVDGSLSGRTRTVPHCDQVFRHLNVLCDGSILSCCGIFPRSGESFESIAAIWGNVNEATSLGALINSQYFRAARARVSGREARTRVACQKCIEHIA